jgi:hypothetical protein
MAKYSKENSRIVVKFIDSDTDTELFELKDRNHMNVGELFTNYVANSIIQGELDSIGHEPNEIMVIAVGYFKKS